jgi:hypothetical protein
MRRAGSPTFLVLTFIALGLAAFAGHWYLDSLRRAGRQTATTLSNDLRTAEQSLAELRAAQASYLAAGQNADSWMTRATAVATELEGAIANLKANASSAGRADALARYETAAALATELSAADRRARGFVVSGQSLVASDVVFMESADPARKLSQELSAARDLEIAGFESKARQLGWISLAVNGLGIALALILALTLARKSSTVQAVAVNEDASVSVVAPTAISAPFSDPFLAPAVDVSAAAELCVDLGRILDGRDLPALISRAAGVLDAKGLVLWVSESNGAVLRPSVAHGYSDRVLQKMGTLPTDSDNVTALAFRTMQPQVVKGTFDGLGAVAVPLITATGCVGVLAAEVQGAKPGDTRFAVTRMIAAQLATLVTPGADTGVKSAQG